MKNLSKLSLVEWIFFLFMALLPGGFIVLTIIGSLSILFSEEK